MYLITIVYLFWSQTLGQDDKIIANIGLRDKAIIHLEVQ